MIRLCSIQPVAERGGSDQALLRMLRSLPSDEFECHVVVPADPPLRAEYEHAGASFHILPMRRISTTHGIGSWAGYAFAWPFVVLRLAWLIRRIRADVVHTNSLHSWYGWAAAAITWRPHVWHAREIVVQSGAALRVERFLTRHFAARVVCGSQAIAEQLHARNAVVVYDAPDPTRFNAARAGRSRAQHGISDDETLVAAIGRIDTWKGIDVLLDSWPTARAARAGLQLVIVGAPVDGKQQYADELAARARTIAGVQWLGAFTEDGVADLVADADVVVSPSTEPEPYGLVIAEALTSGTPVVATDAGGPREILAAASPDAGRLVPMRDAAALAEAIVAVVTASGPTSTAIRAARRPLIVPPPGDLAEVFRSVARRQAGATE